MDVPGFVLITGGASGIGRACAASFAREGCAGIALLDVNESALAIVKEEVMNVIANRQSANKNSAFRVDIFQVDVTNEEQVDLAVTTAAQTFGRLDYVVNAAGIGVKHEGGAAFAPTHEWQRVIDINLTGTFFVLRAAARIMLKQERMFSSIDGRPLQRGSIVNFASILGVVGVPLSTAYTASKHAVVGLTRSASEDYAAQGLRINAVCPGYIETPMTTTDARILKVMQEKIATSVPMQRMGQPNEIADAVLYLAGGRSSFVTGSAMIVDGGYTSR